MKTIFLSYAHPDDEAMFTGIAVPKYASSGWSVHLSMATLGQAGVREDSSMKSEILGEIRKRELEVSAKMLGIGSISYLGREDGGLKDVEYGEMEDELYKQLVKYSPRIVITFDPTGCTNHPDHVRLSNATTYAFQKYCRDLEDTQKIYRDVNMGKKMTKLRNFSIHHKVALKEESFTEAVEHEQTPKLYYACFPASVVKYLQSRGVMNYESYGMPLKGVEDEKVTTVIEAGRFGSKKRKSMEAHVSQFITLANHLSFPDHPLFKQEFFILRMVGTTEVYMGKHDRISNRL